jgi:hypothetical protein
LISTAARSASGDWAELDTLQTVAARITVTQRNIRTKSSW